MMPTCALLLILATLLPLASFLTLVFVGQRMGRPLAGLVATGAIGASFALSMVAMMLWLSGGSLAGGVEWGFNAGPINLPMRWIPVGPSAGQDHTGYLDVGIYIDSLTVAMFAMVTLVSTLVHVFSMGYMGQDQRYPRFFTYLGLFCFSMLGLVLGGTLLQLFIFWELVGLCSYLLIGFWYEKKSAANAAMKAFVTNRVGDFGFLIGFGILFYHLGNATLPNLWVALGTAGQGGPIALPDGGVFGATLLTLMGIGLFFGAVGKSAQFPLHVWLPDAMEGPTPVSALIHAATMVAAGVYLVGRIFPILTPDAKLFIAVIGCTTLTMAALIAVVQSDIKKVLAYSTVSQLGYMILALGIGSWVGGLFHLITHAFFKALLFLGAGSIIHAAHHEQEMAQYGGLWRKIPVTAATFGIAVLAIAGTPFFSGFYSKDLILAHAGAFATYATHPDRSASAWYWAFWVLPAVIAYVTAFYMTRCWMLTFWGKPRNPHLHERARESALLYVPLIVLAVLAVIGGNWLGVRDLMKASVNETQAYCQTALSRRGDGARFTGFDTAWPGDAPRRTEAVLEAVEAPAPDAAPSASEAALVEGYRLVHTWVFWAFIAGIALGAAIYWNGLAVADALIRVAPLRWIHTWLYRRMYFDELYYLIFVNLLVVGPSRLVGLLDKWVVDGLVNGCGQLVRGLAVLAGLSDKYIVDGAVNGAGALAQDVGAAVRSTQSGRIRIYVLILILAVALGLGGATIAMLADR